MSAAAAGNPDALARLAERERRINTAIALGKPDRLPVWHGVPGRFPSERLGISKAEQMDNPERLAEAVLGTAQHFQSDMVEIMPPLGSVLAPLGYHQLKWAGHGLPDESGWQYLDRETMTADEYDELIYDPSDFMVRKYWPRAYAKLAGLAALAPLREGQGYFAGPFSFAAFGTPPGQAALDALKEAGAAALHTVMTLGQLGQQLAHHGFPQTWAASTLAPFDLVGDFLRGRKGIMLDMYRRPEKVLGAAEKLLPMAVEQAARGAAMSHNPRVFIAVHGGIDGFMSPEQYRRFYWPTFQQLLTALAERDLNPFVLVEGNADTRLELMRDVPAGKIIYWFDKVDMRRAREVLGGRVCIAGNVPVGLLTVGTPDEVTAYCAQLVNEVAAGDGGFILGSSGQTEDVRVENVEAMVSFALA